MIQTKFNEHRFTTSDTSKAMGMFLASHLVKRWKEDLIDQCSGKIVTINRTSILMERGTQINQDVAMSINFHIQAGDITEFEVTDQCRTGVYGRGRSVAPWVVTACVKDKNRKFILYAKGVEQALEIAKDYIELKFPGYFEFVGVKGFNDCIVLCDNFSRGGAENDTSMPADEGKEDAAFEAETNNFYLIELEVKLAGEPGYTSTFLVFASDAEKAKQLAEDWLVQRAHEEVEAGQADPISVAFTTTIKAAKLVNCYCVIPPDFTREYFKQEKAEAETN